MTRKWQKRPQRYSASDREALFNAMAPDDYKKRSLLDGVDVIATAMERKWGIDRLRLLASDQLRSAFDQQRDYFDAAIQSGDLNFLDIQANGMKRAWQALDKHAEDSGHKPLSPDVWELKLPTTGKAVAIVRTTAEAHLVATPERETWTLSEIGHLIESTGNLLSEIKRTFPGAEITAIHKTDPLTKTDSAAFDWKKGDDIPF